MSKHDKFEALDSKIAEHLRDVEMPSELEQRLLCQVGNPVIEDSVRVFENPIRHAKFHWSRVYVAPVLAVVTVLAILATSLYFLSDIDSDQSPTSKISIAEQNEKSHSTDNTDDLESLRQRTRLLKAEYKLASLRTRLFTRRCTRPMPKLSDEFWNEQAAGTIVLTADMYRRMSDNHTSSPQGYELVLSHFAGSPWAVVAQNRINKSNTNN